MGAHTERKEVTHYSVVFTKSPFRETHLARTLDWNLIQRDLNRSVMLLRFGASFCAFVAAGTLKEAFKWLISDYVVFGESEKLNRKKKEKWDELFIQKYTQTDEGGCLGDVSINHFWYQVNTINDVGCAVTRSISTHGVPGFSLKMINQRCEYRILL